MKIWSINLFSCFHDRLRSESKKLFYLLIDYLYQKNPQISDQRKVEVLSLAISHSLKLFRNIYENIYKGVKLPSSFLLNRIEALDVKSCDYLVRQNLVTIDHNFELVSHVPYQQRYHNVRMFDVWMKIIYCDAKLREESRQMLSWLNDHKLPIKSQDHSEYIWSHISARTTTNAA